MAQFVRGSRGGGPWSSNPWSGPHSTPLWCTQISTPTFPQVDLLSLCGCISSQVTGGKIPLLSPRFLCCSRLNLQSGVSDFPSLGFAFSIRKMKMLDQMVSKVAWNLDLSWFHVWSVSPVTNWPIQLKNKTLESGRVESLCASE